MRAYLLKTPPLGAAAQMALDEAVLDCARPDRCFLRLYDWAGTRPHGVTFGYSQSYASVEPAVRERFGGVTMPVVRRLSGGGIVYHDGDVTFSFVFPWSRATAPHSIYRRIHNGVHLGLKARAIPSRRWSSSEGGTGEAECFVGPEPEDLVHEDGTKFLGGALRRRRGFGLYQGSLRTEGFSVPADLLRGALTEGLGLAWPLLLRGEEPRPAVAAAAERLRLERYCRDSWNKKR